MKKNNIKIAFFECLILEQGGGLEKYFIETAKNMSNFKSIQADVVTLNEDFTICINNLLTFYYWKKFDKRLAMKETTESVMRKLGKARYIKCSSINALKQKLKEYDVIYSKNEFLEAFVLKFLIGYKNLPPVIFGVHTPHYYPVAKSIQSKIHNLLYLSPLYNWFVSGVKCFHVSNQESYEILRKQLKRKDIVKINYPFDIKNFSKKSKLFKYKSKIDPKKFNILWAGRITEQKGVDDLVKIINSINNLKKYRERITWNIAGDGEQADKIKNLAEKWSNVNYCGYVPNDYMPSLMKQCNLFISTSKWEVSPFNIIEAQSMNLPVIAYNIAGPMDIIENGKTGIIVENIKQFEKAVISCVRKERVFGDIEWNIKSKFNPNEIYKKILEMFESYNEN